ncbi:class I SAM-dependent methyltransferase [Pelagibius litoralis]|uniref:Class I SAM-dependent methyltransferase n=1 Tax=Pelagibius litoralis TaxID=374515 RepID=A0A967F1Y1_9PROT|nr:class I SAM-dependent methyltransferase [Pelagibius litoralis]NIA71673.1 class I SAM-dependent methyltransferase [Pelagibius litoralis]
MTATQRGAVWSRGRLRHTWFGLLTLLGIAERGFFIPYRYAAQILPEDRRRSYDALECLMKDREGAFADFLAEMEGWAAALLALGQACAPGPRWNQVWYPRLDAAAAYTMIRHFAPRRIVEVGCGHSTRFVAQAVRDAGLESEILAIDPAPRADLATLPVTLRRSVVQATPLAAFTDLQAGDFLMIDSSHILVPGSDVDFLFGRVLPLLPAGVIVQVHDIFLPDDYPGAWHWRGYNEQQALLPLLTSGGWEVLFASHYAATRMTDRLAAGPLAALPLPEGAWETALWIRKTAGAPVSRDPGSQNRVLQ